LFGPAAPFASGGSELTAATPSKVVPGVGADVCTTLDCLTVSVASLPGGTGILRSWWSFRPFSGLDARDRSGGDSSCLIAFGGSWEGRGFAAAPPAPGSRAPGVDALDRFEELVHVEDAILQQVPEATARADEVDRVPALDVLREH